ncbi:hypothetical protein ['Camptotheca acuminata' phytoplasma]|uniref:hypothetical protein n=1 Tax='Camptotheca acuminata' phytoplasma TaxID=3239192 RepID=UPI00351A0CE3
MVEFFYIGFFATYFISRALIGANPDRIHTDKPADSPIIKAAVYSIIVMVITFLLSLFAFNINKMTAPLCLISASSFFGFIFSFLDSQRNMPILFVSMIVTLFFLLLNFAVTLFNFFKRFSKKEERAIINRFSFVIFNFFVVSTIYFSLFFIIGFIATRVPDSTLKMSQLFDPYLLLGLIILSSILSLSSVYVASSLVIMDYIIGKKVSDKYESVMAFALCLLALQPIVKIIFEVCKGMFKRKTV